MAEGHRLFRSLALASNPGGALQLIERHTKCDHNQTRQHQACSSQSIGAAVKYLRHTCFPACCSLSSRFCAQCLRSQELWLGFCFGQGPPNGGRPRRINIAAEGLCATPSTDGGTKNVYTA